MYGNPYFNNFRDQQPIQNIFTNQMPLNNLFMAQFLKENEKVEEMFVNHKTAFIDLFKKELKIKDIDGTITTYGLILPKDEKDKKIEELEKQIQELKETKAYAKRVIDLWADAKKWKMLAKMTDNDEDCNKYMNISNTLMEMFNSEVQNMKL